MNKLEECKSQLSLLADTDSIVGSQLLARAKQMASEFSKELDDGHRQELRRWLEDEYAQASKARADWHYRNRMIAIAGAALDAIKPHP